MEDETIEMFRPTGPAELDLVRKSGFRRWPPRLVGQPIFYPVTNRQYATEIATKWNVRDNGGGFVTRFHVRKEFMDRYEIHKVGGRYHTEWWIPAGDLEDLNDNIVGEIEVIAEYWPEGRKPGDDRKTDILARFRSSVEAFGALIEGLDEGRLCEPAMEGWSVRDMAAHFAGYHADMAEAIERIARGEPPGEGDGLTDDERNARYAEEARSRPIGNVMDEWHGAFERCCAAAASLPEERFADGRGVRRWLLEEAEHYDSHAAQVRGWLARA